MGRSGVRPALINPYAVAGALDGCGLGSGVARRAAVLGVLTAGVSAAGASLGSGVASADEMAFEDQLISDLVLDDLGTGGANGALSDAVPDLSAPAELTVDPIATLPVFEEGSAPWAGVDPVGGGTGAEFGGGPPPEDGEVHAVALTAEPAESTLPALAQPPGAEVLPPFDVGLLPLAEVQGAPFGVAPAGSPVVETVDPAAAPAAQVETPAAAAPDASPVLETDGELSITPWVVEGPDAVLPVEDAPPGVSTDPVVLPAAPASLTANATSAELSASDPVGSPPKPKPEPALGLAVLDGTAGSGSLGAWPDVLTESGESGADPVLSSNRRRDQYSVPTKFIEPETRADDLDPAPEQQAMMQWLFSEEGHQDVFDLFGSRYDVQSDADLLCAIANVCHRLRDLSLSAPELTPDQREGLYPVRSDEQVDQLREPDARLSAQFFNQVSQRLQGRTLGTAGFSAPEIACFVLATECSAEVVPELMLGGRSSVANDPWLTLSGQDLTGVSCVVLCHTHPGDSAGLSAGDLQRYLPYLEDELRELGSEATAGVASIDLLRNTVVYAQRNPGGDLVGQITSGLDEVAPPEQERRRRTPAADSVYFEAPPGESFLIGYEPGVASEPPGTRRDANSIRLYESLQDVPPRNFANEEFEADFYRRLMAGLDPRLDDALMRWDVDHPELWPWENPFGAGSEAVDVDDSAPQTRPADSGGHVVAPESRPEPDLEHGPPNVDERLAELEAELSADQGGAGIGLAVPASSPELAGGATSAGSGGVVIEPEVPDESLRQAFDPNAAQREPEAPVDPQDRSEPTSPPDPDLTLDRTPPLDLDHDAGQRPLGFPRTDRLLDAVLRGPFRTPIGDADLTTPVTSSPHIPIGGDSLAESSAGATSRPVTTPLLGGGPGSSPGEVRVIPNPDGSSTVQVRSTRVVDPVTKTVRLSTPVPPEARLVGWNPSAAQTNYSAVVTGEPRNPGSWRVRTDVVRFEGAEQELVGDGTPDLTGSVLYSPNPVNPSEQYVTVLPTQETDPNTLVTRYTGVAPEGRTVTPGDAQQGVLSFKVPVGARLVPFDVSTEPLVVPSVSPPAAEVAGPLQAVQPSTVPTAQPVAPVAVAPVVQQTPVRTQPARQPNPFQQVQEQVEEGAAWLEKNVVRPAQPVVDEAGRIAVEVGTGAAGLAAGAAGASAAAIKFLWELGGGTPVSP